MADIGAKISKKVQGAITAKLKELNAYVDDELPDYIMIMVANKKTEDQMADALSLFLAESTRTFTSWLHNFLAALRKDKEHGGQRKETPISIEPETEDVLDQELLQNNVNVAQSDDSVPVKKQQNSNQPLPSTTKRSKVESRMRQNTKHTDRSAIGINKAESKSVSRKRRHEERQTKDDKRDGSSKYASLNKNELSSNLAESQVREWDRGKDAIMTHQNKSRHDRFEHAPRKAEREWTVYDDDTEDRQGAVSSVVKPVSQSSQFSSDSESEGEELKSSVLTSRVSYPERKIRLPLAKQATKLLLMKAVSEAEISVKKLRAHSTEAGIGSTPSLTEDQQTYDSSLQRRQRRAKKPVQKRLSSNKVLQSRKNKLHRKNIAAKEDAVHDKIPAKSKRDDGANNVRYISHDVVGSRMDTRRVTICKREPLPSFQQPRQDDKDVSTRKRGQSHADATEKHVQQATEEAPDAETQPQLKNPQFIVTLDGVKSGNNSTNALPVYGPKRTYTPSVVSETIASPLPAVGRSPIASSVSDGYNPGSYVASADDARHTELERMRLKMKECSTKLKQMKESFSSVQSKRIARSKTSVHIPYAAAEDLRSICVTNVDFSTTEKQISDYFSICGKLLRVTMPKDSFTGRHKGFAYLEFEHRSSVSSALALDQSTLNNRVIRVALKRRKSVSSVKFPSSRRGYFVPRFKSAPYPRRYSVPASGRSLNRKWINPACLVQK